MEGTIEIAEIKILRGPNYWSNYRKNLIQMKVDIGAFEKFPTNKIEGFAERLKELLPSLYHHECSEERPGGFFHRVEEGTWLGHVAEHIALELQSLAGMECGYGRTRSAGREGVYNLVFSYELEVAGVYAGKAAIRITEALAKNIPCDVSADIGELRRIKSRDGLGPSTAAIVREAARRGIPWRRLNQHSLIQLGQGKHLKLIKASMAGTTSAIGVDLSDNKESTKRMLRDAFIPVPMGRILRDESEVDEIIKEVGFPIVVKPMIGNHGRGIRTNINNSADAKAAFKKAKEICGTVIMEEYIQGFDFRLLVINYKLIAVAKRIPASVTGDGFSTILELVEKANSDPRRGEGHENVLTRIHLDEEAIALLARDGLSPESVLPAGDTRFLMGTANLSTGGTARDVTHHVHPQNVFLAERIARIMNLDICGIDVVAKDIAAPIEKGNGAVIEVNASPGLRMHLSPSGGLAKNVAESIVSMLFPTNAPSRIPLVAVTGTNGKTTITRLIAHMARHAGFNPGFTSTDGIFIDGHQVVYGDCSGPSSAAVVLRDPRVDFAVLECARGGILRSGLGFDHCDTSIITNITDDHLGLGGINTLAELAKVKAVVARSTFEHGHAILNADDDRVYAIREDLDCQVALFSTNDNNERIRQHCANDGIAAVIEKGYFTIWKGCYGQRIAKVNEVPLTMQGRAECMIQNVLPAILAGILNGFHIEQVREALETFIPSPQMTPGRLNIFQLHGITVMVDYAHNPDGFRQLKKFVDRTEATLKVGIIAVPGDRRDKDIRAMGMHAASMFDEIIIRHDKDLRGRTGENIDELLLEGMDRAGKSVPVKMIPDETDALRFAIASSRPGSFIVLLSDEVKKTLDYLKQLEADKEYFNKEITVSE